MICSAYRTAQTTSKKKKKRLGVDKLLKGKWLLEKVPNQFSGGTLAGKNKSQYYVSPFTNTKCNMEFRLTPRITKFLETEQKNISMTIWC